MDTVLNNIKEMLSIPSDVTVFDPEISIHIESALMVLGQLGIGDEIEPVTITVDTVWTDVLGDRKDLAAAKSFVYLKTRLGFDPPSTSYLIEAMERQITELSWRLTSQKERSIDV